MAASEITFGQQLRRLRTQRGLSQEALAERAGLTPRTVAALERGVRRRPYPATLGALAEALDLSGAARAAFAQLASGGAEPAAEPEPHTSATTPPPRLPVWPTTFVGRDAEVRGIQELLDPDRSSVRLLSLLGPGGVGKTRLAVAAAAALAPRYPDGVAFVDLTPVRDPHLVPTTMAHALDVRESGGRGAQELLLEHLRDRRMLLVLDNFEQVVAAAPLLAEHLESCPSLAILVSSRAPLQLRWEHRLPVPPLPTPPDDYVPLEEVKSAAAVRLFVDRAQVAAPEFALGPANAAAIAAICRRLDGMPLAIELAAARTVLLSPAALLRRLERRLPLLTGGAVDLPERQRTLRQTLAWSHDLLGPVEQTLFRRLAVFADGLTLAAAEAVCTDAELAEGEVLERLEGLLNIIVVQRGVGSDGELRFHMLETVREFADEQLDASGEREATLARHATWYVTWAEEVLPKLTGREQQAWFDRLTDELANFRAVREWCHAAPHRGEVELRLSAALGRYWWMRTPGREARQWLAEALAAGPTEPSVARARALTWCGQLDYLHGDTETGRARLEEAVAVARTAGEPSLLCLALRHLALYAADRSNARVLLEEAAGIARATDNRRELALALSYLARAHEWQGDVAAAYELADQAVAAARAAGDGIALTDGLLRLGNLSIVRGDFEAAAQALQEALDLSEQLGYRSYMTTLTRQLAYLALAGRDLPLARARIRASLETARTAGNGVDGLRPLQLAAHLAVAEGQHALGVALFGAVDDFQNRHKLETGSTLWTRWALPGAESALESSRAALGEAAFAAAWSAGQRLPLEAALDQALDALRA